jgi:transposase InsO family protein
VNFATGNSGHNWGKLFKNNYCVYGRRKLTYVAKKKGLDVGRDQVARLMKREAIRGTSRAKKRFTTHADASAVRAPDLVNRNFTATRPDQLWVADFTYCSTWSGIVYVAFVTDVFGRRIVGWKAARSMTAQLVIDPSIGTIGESYDNAMAESMFAIFKTELFRNPVVLTDFSGHWKGLDDLTPAEVEADHIVKPQVNAAWENNQTSRRETQFEPRGRHTLLMDKPTNNRDRPSREVVADALSVLKGAIIFVSLA